MNESPAMPPEPSDAERATWPSCTEDYVAALEATAARVWDFEADWRHQREKRLAAEDRLEPLLAALKVAARKFRQYEEMHNEKGTVEGAQKAAANAYLARECEAAIAKAEGATP